MESENTYKVERPIEEVKEIIFKIEKFGAYHPLIKKTSYDETTGVFRIIESPFPNIPFTFSYSAKPTLQGNRVVYDISGIPFLKAKHVYELSALPGDWTEIRLKVELKGPPILTNWVMKKMFEAQEGLWDQVQEYA